MSTNLPYEGQTTKLPQYTEPQFGSLPAQADDAREPSYPQPVATPAPSSRGRRGRGLLVVAGLTLLFLSLGGRLLPFESGFTEATIPFTDEFDARNVQIDVGSGNITFIRGDNEHVQIEAVKHGFGWSTSAARESAEKFKPEISKAGDTVRIEQERWSGFVLFGRTPYVDYRITLPADAEIEASTGSGNVEASDFKGAIEVDTGSGDLTFRNIEGQLTISVGSGDIELQNINVEQVELQTGSGDITIDEIVGALKAHTGSGNITIVNAEALQFDLQTGSGDVRFDGSLNSEQESRAQTSSGNITMTLPADTNAAITAQTGSGDISSAWDLGGSDHSRRGTIGSGGAELVLEAGSGDITIEEE